MQTLAILLIAGFSISTVLETETPQEVPVVGNFSWSEPSIAESTQNSTEEVESLCTIKNPMEEAGFLHGNF